MKVTFADQQEGEMTVFRRFRYEGAAYVLLLNDADGEPFLFREEEGVLVPAEAEAVEALLPDLADMLDGFSHFSSDADTVTILE